MSLSPQIAYLKRKDIDVDRWDACIEKADNGLIYAYSYYLDAMCTNWDALVLGDYDAVMPLPWRKKWGIKYLYVPAFIQQLGVMGKLEGLSFYSIIGKVQQHFQYGDLVFNSFNINQTIQTTKRTNLILYLNDYKHLETKFSLRLKRSLKVANENQLQIDYSFNPTQIVKAFKAQYQTRMLHVHDSDYSHFLSLIEDLNRKGKALTRMIRGEDNKIETAIIWLIDKNRIYNILNFSTNISREKRAVHYLLNSAIREFAGQNFILDFEGSDLPGVKEFYQNFRPIDQPYFLYHFNHLPFPLNMVKR